MTTITTDPTIHNRVGQLTRPRVTGFLAGAVLTSAVFIGISAASGDSPDTAPASAPTSHLSVTQDLDCRNVTRGPC